MVNMDEINIEVDDTVADKLSALKETLNQFESEMSPMFQKTLEGIQAFGASITLAIGPALIAVETAAAQLAAELNPILEALEGINTQIDWDKLEIELTLENPERWDYESLINWGNRLERAGLLDKYEYRLMYGAECWRAVLHSPIWYAGEAWYWLRNDAWEMVRGLWEK
jgi:hypothetical protein